MRNCPSCSGPVTDDAYACPACGHAFSAAPTDATVISGSLSSPPSGEGARFDSGRIIRDRYRIVALLGRGGMGEVYRADDLKLGQSVALKFLPVGFEKDSERLRLLLDEVRTARQVTHANVCRVHDIDEFEGQHFLSMEYVDGEDLASLLRRIGRLPEERAIAVARQICAGLAAAHEAGVLHRDLKPANVMLDGRGQVRLTDFGLASLTQDSRANSARIGTPAYMAPEQISGVGASERSDIYALGLVLYELFTGKPVFVAETVDEMSSLHASAAPSRPTSHVDSLDPAIERAVLRCLEKDPNARPPSALTVAASLPGGDPLAAALAAGETPSPELVAESGARDGLNPALAVALAVLAIVIVVSGASWVATMSWIHYMPFDKRPEVLQDRAFELMAELGYTEEVYVNPADRAWGWLTWSDVMRSVAENDSSATRWEQVRERPDVGGYWYRQSPTRMIPSATGTPMTIRGPVGLVDPAPTSAGDVMVLFDLDGSLRRFEVLPRRFAVEEPSEPDWGPLFRAAELDSSRFEPVMPRYQRFLAPDLRRAWVGTIESQPDVEYRVEAGASEGRPVLFNVAESGTLEGLSTPPEVRRRSVGQRLNQELPGAVILLIVFLLVRLAIHNVNRQRHDRRGSARIATGVSVLFLIAEGLRSHQLQGSGFLEETWLLVSSATFLGAVVWVIYAAIEPVGRQVWPTMFISSSRLLSRDRTVWRDPVIGSSVLYGMLAGGGYFICAFGAGRWLEARGDGPAPWPWGIDLELLVSPARSLSGVLQSVFDAIFALIMISALVLIQRAVKRRWLAIAATILLWTVLDGFNDVESFVRALAFSVLLMILLLRWGVVSMVVALGTVSLAWRARAIDFGHWTAQGAVYATAAVALMALYGAWAATGRSLRTTREG